VKSPASDRRWLRRPAHSAAGFRPWLVDRGSLTARIQARCASFRVKVVFQGRGRTDRDEAFVQPGGRRRLALVREVYLFCRRTPVVFAHSVIDPRSLRGTWRRLARLGSRPLGAALFSDPRIRRYPLRQKKLNRHHELYRRACAALKVRPPFLWARRSLFALHKSPILVTEVFLPGILKLRS
jgi:chorismate--pyruvate lyase